MTHPDDGESFPPPATSFDASPSPLPPHDPLPAGLSVRTTTPSPPATLEDIRQLLTQLLDESNAVTGKIFESIGALSGRLEKSEERQEKLTIENDKRFNEAVGAARDAANGAMAAAARVGELREAIASQETHDKARLAKLELQVDAIEEWRERQQAAGE